MAGKGCRVPERWTDYIPLGRRMPGTRFIAFKVPLKMSFNRNLHPDERFSPRDLIKKIKEQKEELGLIIDLTYTTRYYRPEGDEVLQDRWDGVFILDQNTGLGSSTPIVPILFVPASTSSGVP
ncbi:rna rnp complex-1-interacting phosphatase [Limosa lapponica baueri]|uniref:Rna rnp complex-1-interacting phosphatase n=1 Tax=Limosa lapponica baueri TaxID=1758121 RepID=A0A2I0TAQ0_LIMLA|nr:rna rnp complex-1-interacting phosphatase [Limosa lapponica baueri]